MNDFLGTSSRSHSNSPNMISYNNQTLTAPRDIANSLNQIFIEKVRKLRNETNSDTNEAAKLRLRSWLETRDSEIAAFELKPIDLTKLRKILKKLKGNRSCGIDFIDGYSIKLAAPILKNILLHLVQTKVPEFWTRITIIILD